MWVDCRPGAGGRSVGSKAQILKLCWIQNPLPRQPGAAMAALIDALSRPIGEAIASHREGNEPPLLYSRNL